MGTSGAVSPATRLLSRYARRHMFPEGETGPIDQAISYTAVANHRDETPLPKGSTYTGIRSRFTKWLLGPIIRVRQKGRGEAATHQIGVSGCAGGIVQYWLVSAGCRRVPLATVNKSLLLVSSSRYRWRLGAYIHVSLAVTGNENRRQHYCYWCWPKLHYNVVWNSSCENLKICEEAGTVGCC
jgi:hypothetical protein